MSKLYGRNLVPFLSPMLEDDLGKKVPAEVGNKIHERNFDKIKECIDMVAQHVNPEDRAIAIKLTAFMPIELLVCFSLFRCVERFLLHIPHLYLLSRLVQNHNHVTGCLIVKWWKLNGSKG